MIVLEHRAVLAIALAEPLSERLLGEVARAGGFVAGPAYQPARALRVLADLERPGGPTVVRAPTPSRRC